MGGMRSICSMLGMFGKCEENNFRCFVFLHEQYDWCEKYKAFSNGMRGISGMRSMRLSEVVWVV